MTGKLANLSKYRYVVVVESERSWQRIRRYLHRRNVSKQDVAIICVKTDLGQWLRQKYVDQEFLLIDEEVDLKKAAGDAYDALTERQDELLGAFPNCFWWMSFYNYFGQYLLQQAASERLAQALIAVSGNARWLLLPAGHLWSGREDIHETNPLLYLILRNTVQQAGRPCWVLGDPPWSSSYYTCLLWLKCVLNVLLLVPAILLSVILHLWQQMWLRRTSLQRVLVFFREPLSTSNADVLSTGIAIKKAEMLRVDWENIRWKTSPRLLSRLYQVAVKLARVFMIERDVYRVYRVDPRSTWARWVTVWVAPLPLTSLWLAIPLLREGYREFRATTRMIDSWHYFKDAESSPRWYSLAVLAINIPEYLMSRLTITALWKDKKPSVVLYPDGYASLVRVAQWECQSQGITSLQAPHGYPNRNLLNSYYRAHKYLAPTKISEQHLQRYGITDNQIVKIADELWRADKIPITQESPRNSTSVVMLVYSGSYPYWSFPNLFYELWHSSYQYIEHMTRTMPNIQIWLKGHPNGSSLWFFESLLSAFPRLTKANRLRYITAGWSKPGDYAAVDVAVSFMAIPSTPTVLFLKQAIPLLVLSPDQTNQRANYPTVANLVDYPFCFISLAEVEHVTHQLLTQPAEWHGASVHMREYAEQILGSSRERRLPLAEYLLGYLV